MTLPTLTLEAQALWNASGMSRHDLAQLLRLAIWLIRTRGTVGFTWSDLSDLADNLHPPAPTLADARLAVDRLDGPEAVVICRFLDTLPKEKPS